jgi:hypothetical protein
MKKIIGMAIMLFISTLAFSQTESKRDIHMEPGSRNIAVDSHTSYVVNENHSKMHHYNWKHKPAYVRRRKTMGKSCNTVAYRH